MKRDFSRLISIILIMICPLLTLGADTVKEFLPTDTYYANPYMGLVAWAESDIEDQYNDFSLVYVDVTWAEIEPVRGEFDFASLEKNNQISMWKSLGKRAVFRLVLDKPSSKSHMDIPQWLYDITGDGVFYDTSYGKGYCPNYENETLIAEHERLIQALASWFCEDDFVTFVQLGSVGHWGEWHIHPTIMPMPDLNFMSIYFEHYRKAFVYGNTQLLMRRPFTFALGSNIGLFNDSLGIEKEDKRWLSWIENGGDYEKQEGGVSAMPEAWKYSAIGGEISSNVDKKNLLRKKIDIFMQTLEASHTSWIGPSSFTNFKTSSNTANKSLKKVLGTIGYRLYVSKLVVSGSSVEVTLSNSGIAPFYFDWTVLVRATVGDNQVVVTPDVNIKEVLPGSTVSFVLEFSGPVEGLDIGVFNPNDQSEGLYLVMNTPRDGYWQSLL